MNSKPNDFVDIKIRLKCLSSSDEAVIYHYISSLSTKKKETIFKALSPFYLWEASLEQEADGKLKTDSEKQQILLASIVELYLRLVFLKKTYCELGFDKEYLNIFDADLTAKTNQSNSLFVDSHTTKDLVNPSEVTELIPVKPNLVSLPNVSDSREDTPNKAKSSTRKSSSKLDQEDTFFDHSLFKF